MMVGLGSLANGGSSSSSSNLSALAPPFRVNRSNPTLNSNPVLNFTDSPYPASPFNQTWVYPHSTGPRPDFSPNLDLEFDSIRTANLPMETNYPYSGLETNKPAKTTHWSNPKLTVKTGTDAFAYHVEAKPYYPHAPPPMGNDASPFVALNEPSYDILSTPGHSRMDVSPRVDYAQSLSGLEHAPKWGGFWNGLANEKQGKQAELDGSFCSEDKNATVSFVYRNYMEQGGRTDGGRGKRGKDLSGSRGKSTDIFGSTSHASSFSTALLDDMFLPKDLHSLHFESLGFFDEAPESDSRELSGESVTNLLNHQNVFPPNQKALRPFDYCTSDLVSATRSSTPLVIRPPSFESTTLAPNTVSPNLVNSSTVPATKHEDFDGHNFLKGKDPHPPLNSDGKEGFLGTSRFGFYTERDDQSCAVSSSTKDESSNKPLLEDALDHRSKARSAFQVPDIKVPDGFFISSDAAEVAKFKENSPDCLDHHNPAVDSPCWKGASGVHFSPFEVFEALTEQHHADKIEARFGLNIQESQIFPQHIDSVKASSAKSGGNSMDNFKGYEDNCLSFSPKRTSDGGFLVKEHSSDDAVKAGDNYLKQSDSIGVLPSYEIDPSRKQYELPHEPNIGSGIKRSHLKPLVLEEEDLAWTKLKLRASISDAGMNSSNSSEDGGVPYRVVENVLSSPSSGEDATELAKPYGRESTPKMDVQMLVNAMCNLSELLLFHCSNDARGLKEKHTEAIKHVISTLDTCISRKIGESASPPEERRNCNVSGKKVGKFPDFVSLRDDREVSKDENLVQAFKNILSENLPGKEEGLSPTLLYKNLWLEAEAELCSVSYKARLDRVKGRMCSSKTNNEKENSTGIGKVSNLENSTEPKISSITPEVKESPALKVPIKDFPSSHTTGRADTVEDSVMTRFQILKYRNDNSNSIDKPDELLPEVVDTGFVGKRIRWASTEYQLGDGSLDVGSQLLHDTMAGNEDVFLSSRDVSDLEIGRGFRLCANDDSNIQSERNKKLANQYFSGWYDNSSSDWEHVLKDEFAWPK